MCRGSASSCLILLLGLAPATAAAQAPAMPEPTPAELHVRAAMNANALMAVAIADARARGVSPREWGLSVGREFAASWGPEQTARSLVRGMWTNLLSVNPGITLRVGEHDDDAASLVLPPDFPSFAAREDPWFGVSMEEFRAAWAGLTEGVAARFGYRGTIETRPDGVVLVIER
jgi:hypothetical protein